MTKVTGHGGSWQMVYKVVGDDHTVTKDVQGGWWRL